jgi:transposase
MRYIELSQGEQGTLEEGFRYHPKFHVRKRFHAVLLNSQQWKVKDIAHLYSVRTRTIYAWLDNWQKYGIAGLFILSGRGMKPTLSIQDTDSIALVKKKWSTMQEI